MRTLAFLVVVGALQGCTTDPVASSADAGTTPDSAVTEECPTPSGPGTKHAGKIITADEAWAAADSPHVVTFGQQVSKGATLTIEPCAVVRVQDGYSITMDTGGKLVANGTAAKPIRIVADDPSKPWGRLAVFAPSTLTLAYVTLEAGGGETSGGYGAIEARGDQLLPAQEVLAVDHVTVKDSADFGVSLRAGGGFTKGSHDLTITGAKKAAMRLLPRLASNVPTGSYTGNAIDALSIEADAYGNVDLEDVVLHARGVPYRVAGEVKVAGDRMLTIEAGVTLDFAKSEPAGIYVDPGSTASPGKGALVAVGTAEQPIVFTSSAKVAGAWRGLVFGNVPSSKNRLEYVRIEYAGGVSRANSFHCDPDGSFSKNEDAALAVFGAPPAAFLKNSTISDSAGVGVNLAYSGTAVDFMPTNTFTRIATCKQSTPRGPTGACPSTVACP